MTIRDNPKINKVIDFDAVTFKSFVKTGEPLEFYFIQEGRKRYISRYFFIISIEYVESTEFPGEPNKKDSKKYSAFHVIGKGIDVTEEYA